MRSALLPRRLCLITGLTGSYSGREVGFAEVTIDLFQARFLTAPGLGCHEEGRSAELKQILR